ncbi:hypothetical protein CCUG60885_00428 [Mycobacteroides salmoniphilum]|uniref:Uncharacterized protein n=1 Tax=Mycobacteroides salmoniphilum TaxID=404941 RepID=A0A4R8SLF6_9MYCO|nr:hypothetical protein CCUG60885_00428 [Mycobacteroides salmoniphilum]TEA03088.1 hypothetical protein CCUG60883_03712 [Mycobacteroides salmoniphilum]
MEIVDAVNLREREPFGTRVAVYTDRQYLPIALQAAARSNIAVIIRDRSQAQQIRQVLGEHRRTTVVVDPGHWRHKQGTVRRPLELPLQGLLDPANPRSGHVDLGTWAPTYLDGSGADVMFTPSRFVAAQDWGTLRSLCRGLLAALSPTDRVVGLIPTHADMLNPPVVSRFLSELEPLAHLPLGFVFAGAREALAHNNRVTGLQRLLTEHQGAWLLGVDALIATDALCAGAAMVGIGIRSGMRWPAAPEHDSNTPRARAGVPGRFHLDLLTYRNPLTYADWYLDSVPSSCRVCGKQPHRYTPTPDGNSQIHEHNVHAATAWCEELLEVHEDKRLDWLSTERIDAADRYRELDGSNAEVRIDPTLVALIRRDNPGWRAPVGVVS